MLMKVGSITLGERDNGDVKLIGGKLVIGKCCYRDDDRIIVLESVGFRNPQDGSVGYAVCTNPTPIPDPSKAFSMNR